MQEIIKAIKQKPYYQDESVVIYNADCRLILPQIPDKSIDLVLTDPPYGLADRWTGGTWGSNPIYDDAKRWDRDIPVDVVLSLERLSTYQIIWGGNLYPVPPSRSWLAWEKSSKMDTLADFELAWTNLDRPSKQWLEDRNPDGKRYHPTQKPTSLISWCILLTPIANTILDPFLGSGTTAYCAKKLGRKCIGVEIEEKYAEIAAKRCSQSVMKLECA